MATHSNSEDAPPESSGDSKSSTDSARSERSGRDRSREEPTLAEIAAEAARQVSAFTGHRADGVISVQQNDGGWQVEVEVVEVRRIPDTTDILAVYEVDLDAAGTVTGYQRIHRYSRGSSQE